LRPSISDIEVVEGDILNDLLPLVDVALRDRDVLLGFEVVLGRKGVAASLSLNGAAVGLDVYDVPDLDPLLLDVFVDGGVQL